MKPSKGFTLIDVLITTVVVGILVAILVGWWTTSVEYHDNDTKAKKDMAQIQTALEEYMVDYDHYPSNLKVLTQGNQPYLKTLPIAPHGSYLYTPSGNPPMTYTLSYPLQSENDTGSNITNGVYILTQKQ